MQINYYKDLNLPDDRVDVYYRIQNEEINALMSVLENRQVIIGTNENGSKPVFPSKIYYLEIVDRRCFAYLEKEVYQIDYSLKSFLEAFQMNGFIQIGKSTIVNIHHIDRIVPDLNMKMNLLMENKEQLILNRAYKKAFIAYLKNMRRNKHEND